MSWINVRAQEESAKYKVEKEFTVVNRDDPDAAETIIRITPGIILSHKTGPLYEGSKYNHDSWYVDTGEAFEDIQDGGPPIKITRLPYLLAASSGQIPMENLVPYDDGSGSDYSAAGGGESKP